MPEMEVYEYEACWLPEGKVMKEKWEENEYTLMQEGHLRYVLNALMGIKKIDSVLELGAGFGRITKILLENYDIEFYRAIDISPEQIAFLNKDFPDVTTSVLDLTTFDSKGFGTYDLVLGCEFFMHIMPEHIEKVFQILKHGKNLLNMDYFPIEKVKRHLSVHNFIHPYRTLYQNIDRTANFHRIYEQQGIFWSVR